MNAVAELASMRLGRRVRAKHAIVYLDDRVHIEEGAEGVIAMVTHRGAIVGVQWEKDEPGVLRKTMFVALEVVS